MSAGSRVRDAVLRLGRSWQGRTLLAVVLLAGIVLWIAPRPVGDVVMVDGGERWRGETAPPRRFVVWQPPRELAAVSPAVSEEGADDPVDADGARITPHLTNGGMTLLFALRGADGQSDLWQSHRTRDGW